MAEETPFIQIDNVSFGYDGGRRVLAELTAGIARGSRTLLAGANGAGKSTFLKLLVGLLRPVSGSIRVAGKTPGETPVHEIASLIAVSLQIAEHHIFSTTVRKEILFGPNNLGRKDPESLGERVMRLFGLEKHAGDHPYDLHPTQRKLLSLATAVAMDTPFLIFDEPTAGLSKPEKDVFAAVLCTLRTEGKGYIIITHDIPFGFEQCGRIMLLNEGRFVRDESIATFIQRPEAEGTLRRAHTEMPASVRIARLLGHHPIPATTSELVHTLKGNSQ